MTRRLLYSFFSFLLGACLATAQPTVVGLPIIDHYRPEEYHGHRQNWAIAQAPNGTLYIANGKGALSYDGTSWELTLLPNRGHVRSIGIGEDGRVYLGANNDLGYLYIDSTGNRQFHSYLPLLAVEDRAFGRVRKTIARPEGTYFQSYNRIFRVHGEQLTRWAFPANSCYRLYECNDQLFVSDTQQGLLKFNGRSFELAPGGAALKGKRIRVFLPFGKEILIGTRSGQLFRYDGRAIAPFPTEADQLLQTHGLMDGLLSRDDQLILGLYNHQGIVILDVNGKRVQYLDKSSGLVSEDIISLFEGAQGDIFVTLQIGIARIDLNAPYSIFNEELGLEGTVQDIVPLSDALYVGTNAGVYRISNSESGISLNRLPGLNSYIWDLAVWQNQLLIASDNGAFRYSNGQLRSLQDSAFTTSAIRFSQSDDQQILITADDGFTAYQWEGQNWRPRFEVHGIRGAVRDVIEVSPGVFWLNTRENGLFRFSFQAGKGALGQVLERPDHFEQGIDVPAGENLLFRLEDQLLIRTEQDSLLRFNPARGSFESYDGLAADFGLQEGRVLPKSESTKGGYWLDYWLDGRQLLLQAERGLNSAYQISIYPSSQTMAYFRDPYGKEVFNSQGSTAWFGGMHGLLQVDLAALAAENSEPTVQITKVTYGSEMLYRIGGTTKTSSLPYKDDSFVFHYSSPQFSKERSIEYRFKMDDNDWEPYHEAAQVRFLKLAPGAHTFYVQARNELGKESKITTYPFTVLPPWYASNEAIALYVLLGLALLYGIIELRSRQLRRERQRLESLVKARTVEIARQAKEISELYQFKNRFLANISHELRTPLTLIIGPAEQLVAQLKASKEQRQASWIYQNAQRLLRLINQILDLSKLEAKQLQLRAGQHDLAQFSRYMLSAFQSLADQKGVKLRFRATEEPFYVYFDTEKMEQILNNLLFNGLKFTDEGAVELFLERRETDGIGQAAITVSDSGRGIHPEQLPYVFDRFFQGEEAGLIPNEGTGIGLALCKELVELHQGTIRVESTLGKGTRFTVLLPLGRDHLPETALSTSGDYQLVETPPARLPLEPPTDPAVTNNQELPLLLLVEDNPDMMAYIKSQFQEQYRIITAIDGNEGVEKAVEEIPDLIISDVMMPGKTGFELSATLKSDVRTDHIPILLLTARVGEEYRIKGLEFQADAYLQKPFSGKVLALEAQNLIENRRKLRQHFSGAIDTQKEAILAAPQETSFMRRLHEVIEAHLNDPQFDVPALGKELGMSKSQLNRKTKAFTDRSPAQFIRFYRLERARELLKSKDLQIAEVAYDVGFSSPAYFTKCFREEYGFTPSDIVD